MNIFLRMAIVLFIQLFTALLIGVFLFILYFINKITNNKVGINSFVLSIIILLVLGINVLISLYVFY